MKAKNHDHVVRGYLKFSVTIALSVSLLVFINYCFISSYSSESETIVSRSTVFDDTFNRQIQLTDGVDSLFNYLSLINNNPRVNNLAVQQVASTKKMELLHSVDNMDNDEAILYRLLMNNVNTFLIVKDSIRILTNEEQNLREELERAMESYQNTSNKLSLSGAQIFNKHINGK